MKLTIAIAAMYVAAIAITNDAPQSKPHDYRGKCVIERYQERHVNDCVISMESIGEVRK